MKEFLKKNILNFILLALILFLYFKPTPEYEVYTEEFCIEWEQGISREDFIYQCYNFKNQEIMCKWHILSDDMLILTEYGNEDNILASYQCTMYAKTRIAEVEIEEERSTAPPLPPLGL